MEYVMQSKFVKLIFINCCIIIIGISTNSNYILNAQTGGGYFSGNAQLEAQTYKEDSAMGAKSVNEQILSNGFFNLNYVNDGLSAGIRYEYYLNPLLGIDQRYKGQGLAYRFVNYSSNILDFTAGNFYEQFGSGIIFRAYEEKALGVDNAIDGIRLKVRPVNGIEVSGIYGTQRYYWTQGRGIVRGGDINFLLNDIVNQGDNIAGMNITAGANFISTYQSDISTEFFNPENVLAWSSRIGLQSENFAVDGEFAYKYNNPNATNSNSTFRNYNPGYGLILNGSYFEKGISASINLHKIDNMDFRSDRNASGTDLILNYIPPLTKQHSYRLATMYPFATKYNGEAGLQVDFDYSIPKNSMLGGKYGTDIALNFSRVQSIDTTHIDEFTYNSPFFGIGNDLFFQDININIQKKYSSNLKTSVSFFNVIYDRDQIEKEGGSHFGKVHLNILVADAIYRLTDNYALKLEVQHQWYKQDSATSPEDLINGNWIGILAELTISPGWYFTIFDDWNYGNAVSERKIHYFNGNIAYTVGSTRFSFGYGRHMAGILCIGGVCRQVPASNGFNLSVSTSF